MDGHSTHRPYETDYKKAVRACLVILSAISCAQSVLPMLYGDYKWLLAMQGRMYPTNLVINIAKASNTQVICFNACLALPRTSDPNDMACMISLYQEDLAWGNESCKTLSLPFPAVKGPRQKTLRTLRPLSPDTNYALCLSRYVGSHSCSWVT
jgi:hypothetical protein